MAKTESTAVNELIELVATQKPFEPDPSEDLMFRTPARKLSAPRMTSTVPPIRGAGDVAPLPRTRAPQGTQRNVPAIGARPPQPTIRVSTAPPAHALAIPPLGPKQLADQAPAEPPDSMIATTPNLAAQLRQSSPRATMMGTSAPPAVPPPIHQARTTTIPPLMPVAAPFEAKPASAPMVPFLGAPATPIYPPAPPYMQHVPHDMTSNQAWFDANDGIEQEIGTARITKGSDWKTIIPKLIAPMIGLIIIGVFVGGYFAFDGDGGKKRAPSVAPAVTTTEVAKTEPAAIANDEPVAAAADEPVAAAKADEPVAAAAKADEPVAAAAKADEPVAAAAKADEPVAAKDVPSTAEIAPVTPPNLAPTAGLAVPGRPKLVDVRIDSKPSGATVMLVDRGKTTFLGTTPISTAVDGSRKYDLVFTYPNKPTQLEHLDPSNTNRVAVTLGKLGNQAKAVKAKLETARADRAVKLEARAEKPAKVVTEREKTVVEPDVEQPAQPAGEGVLMISSKPPCEILVDGASTGLTTPQRAIKLTAGKHKITLVNTTEKIKKTIAVQITADQPTKVIQDLMK